MAKIVPIRKHFDTAQALLASLIEDRPKADMMIVAVQDDTGCSYFEFNATLADMAMVGVTLSYLAATRAETED